MNQHLKPLPVCPQQTANQRFAKISALAVVISAASMSIASATGLVVDTVTATIAATGQFNIKDNAVIVRSGGGLLGPILAPNTGYISTGLNLSGLAPGGANAWWDGYGVNSSDAALDGNAGSGTLVHGIAGIVNELDASLGGGPAVAGPFFGQTVGITDILIQYTCMGDADLDGFITPTDQFLLDNGSANALTGWLNGDFDYDGAITPTDQFLLDNSAGNGCVPPPAPPLAALGAVPEPTSVSLLILGLVGLLSRRGKREEAKN